MKKFYYLILLFAIFFNAQNSQKVRIIDSEDQKPIANARVILSDEILYSNDDGYLLLPLDSKNLNISAPNYGNKVVEKSTEFITLKPNIQNIEEILMKRVDVEKLFKDVIKNYDKTYFVQPSLYEINYKSKGYNNGDLYVATIADGVWLAKNNKYNWKQGFKRNYDDILQIQYQSVKKVDLQKKDSISRLYSNEFSHELMGKYFLNYEIEKLQTLMKSKDAKVSGLILSEVDGIQKIKFSISRPSTVQVKGFMDYDVKNKAIAYIETNFFQDKYPIQDKVAIDGQKYQYKVGDVKVVRSYYLNDGKYLPSLYSFYSDNFIRIIDDKKEITNSVTQIIFKTFKKAEVKNLDPIINFEGNWWSTVPNDKNIQTSLLTKEEQEFINKNQNEE